MTILEELYYGNIHPAEKYVRKDGEYQKLTDRITRRFDKLTSTLNEEGIALLNEICEMISEREDLSEKETFVEGFCLGAQIMKEIMGKDFAEREIL